jgi:CheY-like chemotaxis protein
MIARTDRVNFSRTATLVADASEMSLNLMAQALRAFGCGNVVRCETIDRARKALQASFDLVLIDPSIADGAGYYLIQDVRRDPDNPNRATTIVSVTGHVRENDVMQARDTGANMVVSKPWSPETLLQRIVWAANDQRLFVETESYVGPDRRHKNLGPPAGCDGRRATDLKTPLGGANSPNLSQVEIDQLVVPQRVLLK